MADGPLVRYLRSSDPELNIISRAIRGGWDIPEDKRAQVVDSLMKMVLSENQNIAVKAARILETAVANDRRYELAVLAMLQKDQEDTTIPHRETIDGTLRQRLESLSTKDVHDLLLGPQRSLESASSTDEDDD